nr:BNR repeat-containing protein [Saprospiraceae bacterium]
MKKLGIVFCLIFAASTAAYTQDAKPSQHFTSMSTDGAWCWFSDPRAVSLNQQIFAGWVTSDGSIMVGSYHEKTGVSKQVTLYPQFNKDDHANPSLIILPDNRLMVFFSAHSTRGRGEKEPAISYAITKRPADISEWEDLQRITQNAEGPRAFCYNNPVMLSEEDNRIYIFW